MLKNEFINNQSSFIFEYNTMFYVVIKMARKNFIFLYYIFMHSIPFSTFVTPKQHYLFNFY